jgi:pimeloyl-ACP methyl ester carboxylesterase
VERARFEATRAITIDAPPEAVWPWIVQIGFRRAGFYSYDLLDNLGHPSAERIDPDLQAIAVGDWVAMAEPVNDTTAFRIEGFEPPVWMLWRKPDSTWAWRLERTPSGGTRLVTRLKATYDLDRPGAALFSIALLEFADFPMMRRLLLGLKARAEGLLHADGPVVAADTQSVSHWADASRRRAYRDAYDDALTCWPIPVASRDVPTPFGTTHVLIAGAADGEPLVLVHAASLSATQWYAHAAELGRDHRLYAVDIMGDIGLSTQTRPIHSRDDAADWLASVLDGLGLDRPIFIGSSFGGFQSTNLAVRHPDRVQALALLAPAATIKPFRRLARMAIRMGSLLPLPATVRPGLRGMMHGGLPDERIVRQMEVGVAGFRYDRDGIFPSEIPDDELRRIACPTLLLVGDEEMIYDAADATARARRLIPDVEAEIVPGLGHLLGVQRPGIVNPRLLTFLADRAGAGRQVPVAVG